MKLFLKLEEILKAFTALFYVEILSALDALDQPHYNWHQFLINSIKAVGLTYLVWAVPNRKPDESVDVPYSS